MTTIQAKWVYSIVKALEARLEFAKDESLEEEETIAEALDYFKDIQIPLFDNKG